ncbi:hypothetical protein LCGC14_0142430 [marine sediment metagenome]|uniref:Uncharacterized protein n=1 Tax=marine sediment metagenome TaxID=412755 RepID=A0A0F9Y2U8_9ZZZZ
MKVYLVMQSDQLCGNKPVGSSRVRGVFSTKQKAENEIGPIEEECIKCPTCKQTHSNPKADVDNDFKNWKRKLFIEERTIDE